MQHPHHAHPVDVHLALGIFQGGKLQRAADPHPRIVDEDIQPAFGLDDFRDGRFAVRVGRDIRPHIRYAGQPLGLPAVGPVHLVPVSGEPPGHRPAKSGRDACDQDNHGLYPMMPNSRKIPVSTETASSTWASEWVAIRAKRISTSDSGTAGAITGVMKTPFS